MHYPISRDKYKCVICGNGEREGVLIHVDLIKPRNLGGEATIENTQTLCSEHNLIKEQFGQTQTAKEMFVHLHAISKKEGNQELLDFCTEILEVYERHGINSHIEWTD